MHRSDGARYSPHAADFAAYIAGKWTQTAERRELRAPFDGTPLRHRRPVRPARARGGASPPACAPRPPSPRCRRTSARRSCAPSPPACARAARSWRSACATRAASPSATPSPRSTAPSTASSSPPPRPSASTARSSRSICARRRRAAAGLTRRFPVGLVAGIAPFNFPLNLAVHKIAPAMAAGCPIVLKPATQTPTSTLRLAEIIDGTAWPKGALSVVPATREAADVLTTDERIALLSFTGSAEVGWRMKARAGKKKVVARARRQRRRHRRREADLDLRHPQARLRRLLLRRPEVHQRAAHLRARAALGRVRAAPSSRRPPRQVSAIRATPTCWSAR